LTLGSFSLNLKKEIANLTTSRLRKN